MRLVSFGDFALGALNGEVAVDLSSALAEIALLPWDERLPALAAGFSQKRAAVERQIQAGPGQPLNGVRLRAPVPRPPKLLCALANFGVRPKTDSPLEVDFNFKSPESVIGPGDSVVLSDLPASGFEAEATLAVVIGRETRKVSEAEALSHVFGYTAFLDLFGAGLGRPGIGTFFGKSLDTLGPMGPWIVTADELGNPGELRIQLLVNGKARQDYNTAGMLVSVAGVISAASGIMTLRPGDVVTCGSPADNPVLVGDGDEVTAEIDRIGRLTVKVTDPLKRTWPAAAA
jgi:2-keto-4-pentenoate hydratase/2-oxohepta-3-ene-1,7-dioic acid hydratase in catechol pathway